MTSTNGAGETQETLGDALREALDRRTDAEVLDLPEGTQLTIAQVCGLLGMSPHALRYYERDGLVRVPRSADGHRRYGPQQIRRVEFLRRMRTSGMSMSRLAHYIALVEGGEETVSQRLALMHEHRGAILAQLRELQVALAATDHKISTYGGRLDGQCPHVPEDLGVDDEIVGHIHENQATGART